MQGLFLFTLNDYKFPIEQSIQLPALPVPSSSRLVVSQLYSFAFGDNTCYSFPA